MGLLPRAAVDVRIVPRIVGDFLAEVGPTPVAGARFQLGLGPESGEALFVCGIPAVVEIVVIAILATLVAPNVFRHVGTVSARSGSTSMPFQSFLC